MAESTSKQVARIGKANAAATLMERRNKLAHEALLLRRKGLDYYQIADKLGVSAADARRTVAEAIKAAAALVDEATKAELLYMEVARLDAMQTYVWDDVEAGDIRAGEYVLKLITERMKALKIGQEEASSTTVNAVVVPTSEAEYVAALRLIASGGVKK